MSNVITINILGDSADAIRKIQDVNKSLADMNKQATGLDAFKERLGSLSKGFHDVGGKISDVGGSLTSKLTLPVVGAATAVGGLVAALGWKRLVSLDTAKGQLKGLGYEGAKLDAVMKGVGEGVNGTALSMADGTSLMVGALATGNLALEDTAGYVKRVANVSAAYGVEASHAGRLLNNVLTKNKVTWGDLSQMQENNIPIVTALADHYGVTGDAIEKMASEGKISIEDLNEVLDKNAGAAAEEYGKTWEGITANLKANLGKIGAAVLGPAFDTLKDRAAGFLTLLKSPEWTATATAIGESIGNFIDRVITGIGNLITWWNNLDGSTKKVIGILAGVAVAIGPVMLVLGKMISSIGTVITVFKVLVGVLGFIFSPIGLVVAAIALVVGALVYFFTQTETGQKKWTQIWTRIKEAAAVVKDWFVNTAMPAMAAVWEKVQEVAARFGDWFNTNLVPLISVAIDYLITYWTMMWNVISTVWSAVGEPVLAIIQAVFTAVWDAIVLVIETAISIITNILKAGMALMKGDWSGAWDAIKGIFGAAWDFIVGVLNIAWNLIKGVVMAIFNWIKPYIASAWEWVKDKTSSIWNGIKDAISKAWNNIKSAVSGAVDSVKNTVSNAWNNVKTASTNAWNAVKDGIAKVWDGIKSAVSTAISNVVSTVQGIKGKITGTFSGAASWLLQAGKNILQGLINGITEKIGQVKEKLQSVTNLIPDWKGPAKRDKRLLRGAGQMIMQGLIDGISDEERDLKRKLREITRMIEGTAFGSSRGGVELALAQPAIYGTYKDGLGNTINVNVNVPPTADKAAIGREIQGALDAWVRINGT